MSVLFISYTGLQEPLGQSQVVPYVSGLAARGHEMILASYERGGGRVGDPGELESRLRRAGVRWIALRYHKTPPVLSTTWDVAMGFAQRPARRRPWRASLHGAAT